MSDQFNDPPPPYSAVQDSVSSNSYNYCTILSPTYSQRDNQFSQVSNNFGNISLAYRPPYQALPGRDIQPILHPHFCDSCKQAPRSPGYSKRICELFKQLFCSACNKPHVNAYFSQYQQSQPDARRRCIAHEGYISICPHLRITHDRLKSAANKGEKVVLGCPEPTCPCRNATAIMKKVDADGYQVAIEWEQCKDIAPFQKQPRGHEFEEVLRHGTCPHYILRPNQLHRMAEYAANSSATWRLNLECKTCFDTVTFVQLRKGQDSQLRLHYGVKRRYILMKDHELINYCEWHESLDPKSFGLCTDEKWKHIAWCGDQDCSTSRGFARYHALLQLGSPIDDMLEGMDARAIITALDVFTGCNLELLE